MNLSFGSAIDLRTAIEEVPPPMEHVIQGLGPRYVGALVGAGGVGKGYLTMSIAIGIATGGAHDEIGLVPVNSPPRRVLILGAEDDHLVARHRLFRAGTHIPGHLREMLYQNLTIVCTLGSTPSLVGAFGVVNEKIVDELITAAHGYDSVFIDPLRKFWSGDENNSGDVTAVTRVFDRIAVETGAAVLFSHHVGKGALRNGTTDSVDAGRGSGALFDNVRAQYNISRLSDAQLDAYKIARADSSWYLALDFAKVNHIRPEPTRILRRRPDGTIWHDRSFNMTSSVTRHGSLPACSQYGEEEELPTLEDYVATH